MKHMKSIISLLVALCIVATFAVSAFASEEDSSALIESSSSEASAAASIVTDLNDGKIVKFDTFNKIKYDDAEFTGDTDAIAANGLLYANDDETNKLTLSPELDLGKTWQATIFTLLAKRLLSTISSKSLSTVSVSSFDDEVNFRMLAVP